MVFTFTPNPALDLGGLVDRIVPNEKNYVHQETRFPGGNAINVSRWLTRLKVPAWASGFLGGSIGMEIRSLLDNEKVRHDFVEIQKNTRISITVSNLWTHQQTRFSFPGPSVQAKEVAVAKSLFSRLPRNTIVVVGGSFPPGFHPAHLNSLIEVAHSRRIPVIVDIPGHLLKDIKLSGLSLIKPNLAEFQELTGHRTSKFSTILREACEIAKDVQLVCVSSVEEGALLVHGQSAWFGKTPKLRVKSTVGAGDSMVGAMVAALWRERVGRGHGELEKFLPHLLKNALGAAAATLCTPGTALGTPAQMYQFAARIRVRKIS